MKTLMRRPVLFMIASFLVVALAAGFSFGAGRISRVHAATAPPTITLSNHTVHPGQKITITGQGFAPNDTVTIFMDQPGNPFATLPCDSKGSCSGSFIIPSDTPGQHMLLAQGSQPGETIVNAPIVINPGIFFDPSQGYPNRGGPGTGTAIIGEAFQLNETVSIYWGDATGTLLGTVTSDSYAGFFRFPIITPTHVAPGKYKITAVRSGQKPATVTTTFTVTPPDVTAAGGVRGGHLLKFHLSGFQGYENVAISWNANGGQQISVIQTGPSGLFSSPDYGEVFIPSAPLGSYTLTFTGESSGLHVSTPINVGPGIRANSFNNPGGTIAVTGGGFRSGETLNVFIAGHTKATSVSATTAADGSFQVNLIAPISLTPGQYYAVATNSDGTEKATAFFYILAPGISWASADIYNQNNTAAYGSLGTISGQDFPANEQVTLYWNYQQAGQVKVGTVQAAADGSFSFELATPSSPFTTSATIEAIASTSTFTASSQVQPQAAIVLNPTSALVGQTVHVNGGSFEGNAGVSMTLNGSTTVVGTATTASDGTFTTSFSIPSNANGGLTGVSVSDGTSSSSANLVILVPLTITPATGSSGTSITVQSANFSDYGFGCYANQPYIAWYDPTTGTSQYLSQACSQGPLNETVTAPANLVSGRTYEIELISATYIIGQAPFTAQ